MPARTVQKASFLSSLPGGSQPPSLDPEPCLGKPPRCSWGCAFLIFCEASLAFVPMEAPTAPSLCQLLLCSCKPSLAVWEYSSCREQSSPHSLATIDQLALAGLPCGVHPIRRGIHLGSGLRWAPLGGESDSIPGPSVGWSRVPECGLESHCLLPRPGPQAEPLGWWDGGQVLGGEARLAGLYS